MIIKKEKPLYDLMDSAMLAQIVATVESQTNRDRILKHKIDYEIANENQREHVLNALKERYPDSYDSMVIIALGIAKKILRKLSRAYSAGVKREIIDKETKVVNDKMTKLINFIYNDVDDSDTSFDDTMISLNEHYENHRYAELYTYLEDFRLRFKSLPQALFTALPNRNKTKAEVIVFERDTADYYQYWKFIDWENETNELDQVNIEGLYTVWSKEYNFTFAKVSGFNKSVEDFQKETSEKTFKYIISVNDNNKEKINPYGIMPFVQAKQKTSGNFYPWGSEIAQMSKEMNIIFSDIVSIAAEQGFGQAVQYYSGENPPAIRKTGPTHVINIENSDGKSKFEFANANPDLQGHLDIALSLIRLLLTTNDLTTDNVSGEATAQNFSSAIDRLIADSELITNIDDQRKKFHTLEKRQLSVNFAFLKYLLTVNSVPEDYPPYLLADLDVTKYELRLTFNSIKPQITEKDKASTIKELEEGGFIFPWEKHMRFSEGNMTEEEAKLKESQLEALRKERQKEALQQGINQLQDDLKNDKGGLNGGRPDNNFQPNGNDKEGQGSVGEARPIKQGRQDKARSLNNRANEKKDKGRDRSNARRERIQTTK